MSFNSPPTTSNLLLSLESIGNYFERKFSNNLQFPIKGIYKHGDVNPTLINGYQYFVLNVNDKTNTKKILEDINVLQTGDYVVDKAGNILLSPRDVENRYVYLSDRPSVPTVGFDIVKLFIEHHITTKNVYTKESHNIKHAIIRKIIGNDVEDIFDEINNDLMLLSVYNQVDYFIGKDIYYIYFLRRTGLSDLLIEKTIDWRAYQWELTQNTQENDVSNFN